MKYKKKKSKNKILLFVISLVVLSIGYAYLTSELKINGISKIKKTTWDIYFSDLSINENSVTTESSDAARIADDTQILYKIKLEKPGDFYEFTVKAVNDGNLDAMIDSYNSEIKVDNVIVNELPNYLDYKVMYIQGDDIRKNQYLKAHTSETIKIRIEFKKNITEEDLLSENKPISIKFSINYVQATTKAISVVTTICEDNLNVQNIGDMVCKRAKYLHTEDCKRNDSTYFCSGYSGYTSTGTKKTTTITYGTCGTSGTLTPGDAFDCDVNNDGDFDEDTERFYYVSPKDADETSEYVTLIYYNNVRAGAPNNNYPYQYNSSNLNYQGPINAYGGLPSTSKWTNQYLNKNMTRQITNTSGTTVNIVNENSYNIVEFTYTNRAARFLTYQEVVSACGSNDPFTRGYLKKCLFLLENTLYSNLSRMSSFWLETPLSTSNNIIINLNADNIRLSKTNSVSRANASTTVGVRPAIEVPKSKIIY